MSLPYKTEIKYSSRVQQLLYQQHMQLFWEKKPANSEFWIRNYLQKCMVQTLQILQAHWLQIWKLCLFKFTTSLLYWKEV